MSLTVGQDTWTEVRGRYPTGRNTTAALSAHTEGKCTGRYNTGRASVRRSNTLRIAGSNDQMNALEFRQLYPFPSKRFHALLNSLFKVLCNFLSRYLFAIGLVAVFSLLRCFPPSLTLSSKFFATFPPRTCLLTGPWPDLALDEVYHPLWTAISGNPTPSHNLPPPTSPSQAWHLLWTIVSVKRT